LESTNLTDIIIKTINNIFQTLFSSIDSSIYSFLDDIVFVDNNILNESFMLKIFGTNSSNGLLLIVNSLLVGFLIYYGIRLLYSHYLGLQIERPYQFVFKIIIFGICINCSLFILEQLININSFLSSAIREVGENIFNCNISFTELVIKLNESVTTENPTFNIFSFEGIIKSFTSIGLLNLIFSYSLRYIMLKVFILITPFAILTLINNSTSWFFKMYLRTIISLLLLQSLVSIILIVIFTFNFDTTDVFSQLMYIGGIYALIRANSYMKELLGGISTDVSNNLSFSKKLISK
jgi:hypothetical protein